VTDLAERASTPAVEQAALATPTAKPPTPKRATWVDWLTTTDHKRVGHLYLISSGVFFAVGGLMALVMRAQVTAPGLSIVTPEAYNQLFTMHGSIMLLLYAMPFFTGIANVIMPVQIGAPDVAFPRLNAFSFWLFLFGGLIVAGGLLTPQGAADFGWTAYFRLASNTFGPSLGNTLWFAGAALMGFGTILAAVNFVTTIVAMRAPGMTMFRLTVFTWNTLVTSILILIAFPVLAAALFGGLADRVFDAHIYDAANGGPILWQHLFWFWGHPEVYIIVLPFFGIISEILPVFSRKPIFGYKTLVFATIAIAALSVSVWAHHMYVTGSVLLPFFGILTMLIAVGFLINFIFGGLTGVILSSPVLDFHLSDTYFVVAHFHYVLVGAVVFASFAGTHFWWPKLTGKMLNERLGKLTFWLLFIGFNTTFLVQHWIGVTGLPRRYWTYLPEDGITWMNQVSSIGSVIMSLAVVVFILNIWITARNAPRVGVDDPWGFGRSLEWATASPIPRHNFTKIPRIRSESPAFDANHPELPPPATS